MTNQKHFLNSACWWLPPYLQRFRVPEPDLSGPFRPAGRFEPDSCHSRLYSYCSWYLIWRCRHREYVHLIWSAADLASW